MAEATSAASQDGPTPTTTAPVSYLSTLSAPATYGYSSGSAPPMYGNSGVTTPLRQNSYPDPTTNSRPPRPYSYTPNAASAPTPYTYTAPHQPILNNTPHRRTSMTRPLEGFVANDPFRHSAGRRKHEVSDNTTFDDIDVNPPALVHSAPAYHVPPTNSQPTPYYPPTYSQPPVSTNPPLNTSPYYGAPVGSAPQSSDPAPVIPSYGSQPPVMSLPLNPQSSPSPYIPYNPPSQTHQLPYYPPQQRPQASPYNPYNPPSQTHQLPYYPSDTSTAPVSQSPAYPDGTTHVGHQPLVNNPSGPPTHVGHVPLSAIPEASEPPSSPQGSITNHPPPTEPWTRPDSAYYSSGPAAYPPATTYGGQLTGGHDLDGNENRGFWSNCFWISLFLLGCLIFWPILLPWFLWRRRRNSRHEARPDSAGPEYAPVGYAESKPESTLDVVVKYSTREIPKEVYNHLLLRLPSLYFSRVARIFEEADLSLSEIKKMALETGSKSKSQSEPMAYFMGESAQVPELPPVYNNLKHTWENFIDSVMREWKTFNIISVLLLSAILTILQIEGAGNDALTRYTAIASLVCALMSLLYGCVYIIRFGTMRKTYKAAEWALEAKKSKAFIFWNVWVLLAMPAVWLSWSLILYLICIMSFLWRSNTEAIQHAPLSEQGLLAVRITISTVFGLGLLYGALVLMTFGRYGDAMDRAWKRRIEGWIATRHEQQQLQLQQLGYLVPPPGEGEHEYEYGDQAPVPQQSSETSFPVPPQYPTSAYETYAGSAASVGSQPPTYASQRDEQPYDPYAAIRERVDQTLNRSPAPIPLGQEPATLSSSSPPPPPPPRPQYPPKTANEDDQRVPSYDNDDDGAKAYRAGWRLYGGDEKNLKEKEKEPADAYLPDSSAQMYGARTASEKALDEGGRGGARTPPTPTQTAPSTSAYPYQNRASSSSSSTASSSTRRNPFLASSLVRPPPPPSLPARPVSGASTNVPWEEDAPPGYDQDHKSFAADRSTAGSPSPPPLPSKTRVYPSTSTSTSTTTSASVSAFGDSPATPLTSKDVNEGFNRTPANRAHDTVFVSPISRLAPNVVRSEGKGASGQEDGSGQVPPRQPARYAYKGDGRS